MFLQLNNGDIVSLYWLDNITIDENDDTQVNYIYVNGAKKIEKFDNASDASSRREAMIGKIILK